MTVTVESKEYGWRMPNPFALISKNPKSLISSQIEPWQNILDTDPSIENFELKKNYDQINYTVSSDCLEWTDASGTTHTLFLKDVVAIVQNEKTALQSVNTVKDDLSTEIERRFLLPTVRVHTVERWRDCTWTVRWQDIDFLSVHTASQVALQVNSALQANAERPKRLLAFINPFGGKRLAPTVYQNVVSPLFNLAGVHVEVVVTERGGHAAEVVGREDLGRWDGLVAVGGDGFFSEVLNALTHRSDRPETLRIGLIPGGSTNCVVQTAQGANDPVTATLQIITGARLAHDLCLVSAGDMRKYAASMVAYGFYGDIIANSNSLRWMGPTRYDYTGLQMFMRKQSYPMKMYLRLANIQRGTGGVCVSGCAHCPKDPPTCEISILHDDEKGASAAAMLQTLESMSEEELSREGWKIVDGKFICINVLATACKSPHAPKGMAPHAHLSDGCLEVVLVRDCAHPLYLAHLACLANPKADHFDFDFVENYKVKEAVFAAPGGAAGAAGGEIQGNWMADGELFPNGVVHLKARSNFVHVFGTRPYFPPSVTPNLKLKPSEIVDCQVGSGSGEGGTAGVVGAGEKGAPTAV